MMKSSHARILSLAFLAGTLASCHDTNTSADTMYGPENVLQAPVLDGEENHQFNKTNDKLYQAAVEAGVFYSGTKEEVTHDSSAAAAPAPDMNAHISSSDSIKPVEEHTAEHAGHHEAH